MIEVVDIKFPDTKEIFPYQVDELEIKKGDVCVVETRKGMDIGVAFTSGHMFPPSAFPHQINKVIRLASPDDLKSKKNNAAKCRNALRVSKQKIKEREMKMKIFMVTSTLDNSRMTFYFTAKSRVDFRELVKDLAHIFKTRIEMRQIGIRDEAKKVGGYGVCGGALCCASFLRDFKTVTIRMAKEQNLSLSPTKISGMCGRLMCCLTYEQGSVLDLPLPKTGERFFFKNEEVVVVSSNYKKNIFRVRAKSGKIIEMNKDEYVQNKILKPYEKCKACEKPHKVL